MMNCGVGMNNKNALKAQPRRNLGAASADLDAV
jgi:hypothetical protein